MSNITTEKFKELLARARKLAKKDRNKNAEAAITSLEVQISDQAPQTIELGNLGIRKEHLENSEHEEEVAELVSDIITPVSGATKKDPGVVRDVFLNEKQTLFSTTVYEGEDCVLIGAAGTGKTTATGKTITRLVQSGKIGPLGSETKWLHPDCLGILVCSFTRKAVNNIRRAVPEELRPHVLTIHKVLEFAPVFYEVEDSKNPGFFKKTMKFEPQKTAQNPLPSGLKLIIFEESSMISVELYNQLSAALPHQPQEIFLGDINQLPPIFGPAILGFKMSLLPIIELTEVYRQALLSPIIRLAHSILSGDSSKFNPKVETREELHPHLKEKMTRKYVSSLEAFNEEGEHGSVKIQIWQKKLPDEFACETTVKQFIAWMKNGYYKPYEDIILCPFNKAYGTIELNKGIQQYLSLARTAIVHEVISGLRKHYLAVGDRILFDKEDAIITDIRRNLNYLGRAPQVASVNLDRWGAYQQELTEEEELKAAEEDGEFSTAAIDKFMEAFDEDEERVNSASHVIDIRFTYSDETLSLSTAGDVNNILGGHAITVHKAQGSENEAIFLVLHHSHAVMVNNELLYTAVTRARNKLHIICETDSFFKGVKTHKVRGVSLQDKINYFKGKVEFKEMQEEMEFLKKLKEQKEEVRKIESAKIIDFREAQAQRQLEQQKVEKNDFELTEPVWSMDNPSLHDIFDNNSTSCGAPLAALALEVTQVEIPKKEEKSSLSSTEDLKAKMLAAISRIKR